MTLVLESTISFFVLTCDAGKPWSKGLSQSEASHKACTSTTVILGGVCSMGN